MPPPTSSASPQSWLDDRVRAAGQLPQFAWLLGLLALAASLTQAFTLAVFFQQFLFDHQPWLSLWPWWAAFSLLVIVRAALGWAKDAVGIEASVRVRRALRTEAINHVQRLGPGWKTGTPSGTLVSIVQEQIDGVDAYVARYLAQQKLAVFGPALILVAVFPVNWICGLILLGTAPLIPLFMILVGKGAAAVQTKQLQALNRMSGHFLDVLRGLPTLKLLGAHQRQTAKVASVTEGFRVRTMEVLRLAFLSSTILEFFAVLAIALTAIYLGFTLLGQINFGLPLIFQTALFVLVLAPDFYQPLRDLGTLYHARAEALASAAQLRPLFETPSPLAASGLKTPVFEPPQLELHRVSFAYQPEVPVLKDFSLRVDAGDAVALTGPSGVGKTTVLRLFLGQLTAASGNVLVHGEPLSAWDDQAWRSQVGWMSQHPRLLAGSLRENLQAADPGADDNQLYEALNWAGLDAWASRLSHGLDTLLGEGGRNVSGGQLRRLALARLRLRPSTVLLLDEPTASLDDETERLVLERLDEFRAGKTLLLLTHHPRPLQLVQRVVTMNAGERAP